MHCSSADAVVLYLYDCIKGRFLCVALQARECYHQSLQGADQLPVFGTCEYLIRVLCFTPCRQKQQEEEDNRCLDGPTPVVAVWLYLNSALLQQLEQQSGARVWSWLTAQHRTHTTPDAAADDCIADCSFITRWCCFAKQRAAHLAVKTP